MKILIVDPSTEALEHIAALLLDIGFFNTVQAENGTEALAMINGLRPDVIIANQNTPIISGLNLLRLVRRDEECDRESIFVIFGDGISARLLAQAGRSGANALIMTPCGDEIFRKHLFEALSPMPDEDDERADQLYEKSVSLMESGDLDEALEVCQSILEVHASAEIYFNMGYIKSMKNLLDEAMVCFRRATAINSHHARAYKHMGLICQKLGNGSEAQIYLERAAEIYMEQGQDSEAEEIFSTVLALRPNTTNVYNSLGIIYRRQQRFEESLRAYEKAIKVHPQDEHIYFNAARTCLDLHETDKARWYLRRAVELNPTFTAALDLIRQAGFGDEQ